MVQDVQFDAATRVESAAAELLKSFDELPDTIHVYALLETLRASQQLLADAYQRLADLHEKRARAAMRVELARDGAPENRAWLDAEVALREAGELAGSSADSLAEAHRLNGIARWQSDITADF